VANMLLVNPRRRRRKAASKPRARRQSITVMANPKRRSRRARRQSITVMANPKRRSRRSRRMSNPIGRRRVMRRRRNPSMRSLTAGLGGVFKNAALGAVGSVGVDYLYGMVRAQLPQSLQVVPGAPGAGDAVKALLTVLAGRGLSKFTKGMSNKMAEGALTVQLDKIVRAQLPASITAGLGYSSAATIIPGTNRIGPNTFRAYTQPGAPTALLSRYRGGQGNMAAFIPGSPLLRSTARDREMSVRR